MTPNTITLTEILSREDYHTAAIVGNYALRRSKKLDRGFDFYDDSCPQKERTREFPERIASSLTDEAIRWLSKNHNRKFFLWLHYQDPHGPYTPMYPYNSKFRLSSYGEYRTSKLLSDKNRNQFGGIPWYQQLDEENDVRFYLSQYDGEILFLDFQIGKLLEFINKIHLNKNTIIILTADHGEALDNDHGYYFSHMNGLTDDQIRVPLIIKQPGIFKKELIVYPVSTLDITPTVLNILGIKRLKKMQGKNLFERKERYVFSEKHLHQDEYSIIQDDYKLIYKKGQKLFYNLHLDPEESKNLYNPSLSICIQMEKKLLSYIMQANSSLFNMQATSYYPSKTEMEKLESLGYFKD